MRKIALSPLLSLLMFGASLNIAAQTILTTGSNRSSPVPSFYCDAASSQPILAFSQFECRGVPLYQDGTQVDQMFWFSGNLPQEWWLGGSVDSSSPYDGSITQVTQFSLPNPHGYLPCSGISPLNGTVTYVTEFTDENGVKHTGTFRASWGEYHVCGRWGWYLPVLKVGSSLTVN
jgi:hypothetical protein